jgi:2-polyprenyl-6-methoxyphenol hydroxylase-like FAD-dependent oxidoreductase
MHSRATAGTPRALTAGAILPGMAASGPERVTCCIAGCGPAGAMLGFLLARAGVEVLVLEKHGDFLRDFRGDTIHPSTLEVVDELGLIDEFLSLPHRKVTELNAVLDQGSFRLSDFSRLHRRHPYLVFMPQWDFLDFITSRAGERSGFALRMNAEVLEPVRVNGRIAGVRYRAGDGEAQEARADLTVAADGRGSALRRSAGLTPTSFGAPMDVLWFRISRRESDPENGLGRITAGRILAFIDRGDYWQIACVIPKGSAERERVRGIDAFRDSLARLAPFLADRVGELESWDDLSLLTVQVDRLARWHRPGLLCIGDAAHAMSPIGGVGINLAIQDAVAAANLLAAPLRGGMLTEADLARVQRRRMLPTIATQLLQRAIQRRVVAPTLAGRVPSRPPRVVRLLSRYPALQVIPARLIGVGFRPEHVRTGSVAP